MELEIGDEIVVTEAPQQYDFYKVGDKAKLLYKNVNDMWIADFRINGKFYKGGIWWLTTYNTKFIRDVNVSIKVKL